MRHPGRGIEIAAQLARATPVVAPEACCKRFVPLTFCREEARLLDANGTCNVSTARNTGKEAMGLLIAFSDEVLRPALARACGACWCGGACAVARFVCASGEWAAAH